MSILIRGMEMPTSCFECKLLDYTDTFRCRFRFESLAKEHSINISRPSWCPLVPVPPHGRLIDADANIATLQKCEDDPESELAKICYGYAKKVITACPTVIEAEEGE